MKTIVQIDQVDNTDKDEPDQDKFDQDDENKELGDDLKKKNRHENYIGNGSKIKKRLWKVFEKATKGLRAEQSLDLRRAKRS